MSPSSIAVRIPDILLVFEVSSGCIKFAHVDDDQHPHPPSRRILVSQHSDPSSTLSFLRALLLRMLSPSQRSHHVGEIGGPASIN